MNDRELLENAAKAAGIPWPQNISSFQMQYDGARPWHPLRNDGDAFRLAVKLALEIDIGRTGVAVRTGCGIKVLECSEDTQCGYAATRRAIVLAAAEIGKNMP